MAFRDFTGFESGDPAELVDVTETTAGNFTLVGPDEDAARHGDYHLLCDVTDDEEAAAWINHPPATPAAPDMLTGFGFKFTAYADRTRAIARWLSTGAPATNRLELRLRADGKLEVFDPNGFFDAGIMGTSATFVLEPGRWYYIEVLLNAAEGYAVANFRVSVAVDGVERIAATSPIDYPGDGLDRVGVGILNSNVATLQARFDDFSAESGANLDFRGNAAVTLPILPAGSVQEDEWTASAGTIPACLDDWPGLNDAGTTKASGYGVLAVSHADAADVLPASPRILSVNVVALLRRTDDDGALEVGVKKIGSAFVYTEEASVVEDAWTRVNHCEDRDRAGGGGYWTATSLDLYSLYLFPTDGPGAWEVTVVSAFVLYSPTGESGGGGSSAGTGGVAVVPGGAWYRSTSAALSDAFVEQPNTWQNGAARPNLMPAAGSVRSLAVRTQDGLADNTEWEVYLDGVSTGMNANTQAGNGKGLTQEAAGEVTFSQGALLTVKARRTGSVSGRQIQAVVWVQYDA